MKVKIVFSYNGSKFFGSQIQPNVRSVEGELNRVLEILQIPNRVVMSSRTDRGVHALRQVCHLELPNSWNGKKLFTPLSKLVSDDISILSIDEVDSGFHARYSAESRSYRYILSTSSPNPFLKEYISYIEIENFDFSKVQQAISIFKGTHNFQNFRKSGSDTKSDIRTIFEARAYQWRGLYIFKFRANGFLRSQIRLMAGALIDLAIGKVSIQQLQEQLEGKKVYSRYLTPPNGLYLVNVQY